MNKEEYISFDKLIEKSVQEKVKNDLDIDIDKAWEKFNQTHLKKYAPTKFQLKLCAIACALLIFLTASLFLHSREVTALNIKFFNSIVSFLSGKVQSAKITYGVNTKKESTEIHLPLDVSRALEGVTSFHVLLPVNVLGIYQIDNITLANFGAIQVLTIFLKSNGSNPVIITQMNIEDEFGKGISYDTDDTIMKKVNIRGQEATLLISKNNFSDLSWVDRDVFITIKGPVSEEDIFLIANSMRRI